MCSISAPGNLPELIVDSTGKTYLRLHGKKEWYRYNYSNEKLDKWKNKIEKSNAEICYIYFNNDYEAYAVKNAIKMKELLS